MSNTTDNSTDTRLSTRAAELADTETAQLVAKTPESKKWYERALRTLPLGVPSSFQAGDPYPIYIERGERVVVTDVDGNDYLDFHGGFGVGICGHAHPAIVEAVNRAVRSGTHFAAPTPVTVELAEEICRRFNLDQVRFANSGTEATMDAIRVARAATGREVVAKIEGSYHGHHDTVMFSVLPNSDAVGGRELPSTTPMSLGIPSSVTDLTVVVPFNDAQAFADLIAERGDEIACLILEPVMMNVGIIEPDPGYLQALRDICDANGTVLIFDEVKAGATVAPGGAQERYGVRPHLACYAKALFGGTPGAAFGGEAAVMDIIANGAAQMGTFNGNPLVAAAGLACLTEVLVPEAYDHLAVLGDRLAAGCQAAIDATGIPAHTVSLAAKGCVSFRAERSRNYRDFLESKPQLFGAAYPWALNRGLFMTPGDEEQWTLSVQHTEADVDRYVEVFTDFCHALAED
ncbi:MAG: aspartate aminotransferase family protein [Actinobacteria bacterium]|nr:aspartate aminotransferase family protein [Actinomycetota bacterium]